MGGGWKAKRGAGKGNIGVEADLCNLISSPCSSLPPTYLLLSYLLSYNSILSNFPEQKLFDKKRKEAMDNSYVGAQAHFICLASIVG